MAAQSDTLQCTFLDQPEVIYRNHYNGGWYNVMVATLDNKTWICDSELHLIDETGEEKQTFKPDVPPKGICIHPVTGKLFCTTWSDNKIRCIDTENETTNVMFTTGSETHGIGCTTDDHLVITHPDDSTSKLCVYNFGGDIISTYNYTGYQKAEVSVCKNTSNIALIQHHHGVTVLNNKLQVLYTYNDIVPGQRLVSCPVTVGFVDKYLLVGEEFDRIVRVVLDGTLIRSIHVKGMSQVRSLCVQTNPCVVTVGCVDPCVIWRIKYLE